MAKAIEPHTWIYADTQPEIGGPGFVRWATCGRIGAANDIGEVQAMCDCAQTMKPGDRFMSPEGLIGTVQVRSGERVVATIDGGALIEDKYDLRETELHRVNCPDGGYPY